MIVNGIIAEYNPFHNGHLYHMEESRHITGADYTVVVMSGDFVQRGGPALADKHLRAEMALCCGADLVLELPVLYATASSEYFAAGAVALLDKLGVVTHLCFGSECGDAGQLKRLASFLLQEPAWYRAALKGYLKQGFSYPDARARALSTKESFSTNREPARSGRLPRKDDYADTADAAVSLLCSPNNILGIDYIKETLKRKSDLVPMTIQRTGAGYHDLSVFSAGQSDFPVSSLALRRALQEGGSADIIRSHMPHEAAQLLVSYLSRNRGVYADALSGILYYKLLTEQRQGYEAYLDVSRDLSNRIRNSLNGFTGFEAFCTLLKTKAFTHTRISRCLLHILLGIKKEDMDAGRALDYIPYARVLGFRRSAAPMLGLIKSHSSIPLITKPADAAKILPQEADRLWELDILASELYMGIALEGTGRKRPHELSTPLVIL